MTEYRRRRRFSGPTVVGSSRSEEALKQLFDWETQASSNTQSYTLKKPTDLRHMRMEEAGADEMAEAAEEVEETTTDE
jgi:hypothetical protein